MTTSHLKDDAAYGRNYSSPSTPIVVVADVFERDALMDLNDAKIHEYEVGSFYRSQPVSGNDRLTAYEMAVRTAAMLQWKCRYSTRGTRFYAVRVGTMMLVMRHLPPVLEPAAPVKSETQRDRDAWHDMDR